MGPRVEHGQLPRHISSSSIQAVGESSEGTASRPPQHQGGSAHVGGDYPQILDVGISRIHSGTSTSAGVVTSPPPPSRVQQGFMPSSSGTFDATNSTDLPGSRSDKDLVITTPPHSQTNLVFGQTPSRSRAKSIEDVDRNRENYAPGGMRKQQGDDGESKQSNSFCLGLSSLMISKEIAHSSSEPATATRKREGSVTSETSTISVRHGVLWVGVLWVGV